MVHDNFAEERGPLHGCSDAITFFIFFSLDRLILIDDHAVLYYVRYQYPDLPHNAASVRNWCDSEHHHQT